MTEALHVVAGRPAEEDQAPPADDGYPYRGMPRGWFQVAWSGEIENGTARPMRYFGTDLVAYRASEGQLHVLDAHCPHLGAHLGYGGMVEGACLRCPYHGWLYDSNGRNVEIPRTTKPNRAVRIRTWHVRERYGLVFVWYDPQDSAPGWELPAIPDVEGGDFLDPYPDLVHTWTGLKIRPQYIIENTVDIRHQEWVHRSPSAHDLIQWEVNGPFCHSRQRAIFGKGQSQTWLTPSGPVEAYLDVEAWGIGINVARFIGTDNAVHVGCHTPIDERHIDERLTMFTKREEEFDNKPGSRALRRFQYQVREVSRDIVVWENMRYVARPPFTSDESRIWRELRKWSAGFYGDTKPPMAGV